MTNIQGKDVQIEARFRSAAEDAVGCFPISVHSLDLVNVSENVTWRVTDRTGERYVLRLHRPGYHSLEELNAERLWIRALRAAGIDVPQGIRSVGGDEYVTVRIGDSREWRHAGLAHWADGEVLGEQIESRAGFLDDPALVDRWFGQLGALIAAMHNQACDWRPPATFKRHVLDADGLMGEQPFWGRFWEHPALLPAQSALLSATRAHLHTRLGELDTSSGNYSVIHADLHPYNLVVHGPALAVIDFDDAGFGWHAYDLAVALLPYRTATAFDEIQRAVLRGYRSCRPLADVVTSMIPVFMLVRRLAIVGWLMHRPELGRSLETSTIESICEAANAVLSGGTGNTGRPS